MHIEQIWTGNAYRNFNYLIACPETGEALAIDPLDHEKCLSRAKEKMKRENIEIKIDTNEYDGKEYTCIFCGYVIYEKKEKEK